MTLDNITPVTKAVTFVLIKLKAFFVFRFQSDFCIEINSSDYYSWLNYEAIIIIRGSPRKPLEEQRFSTQEVDRGNTSLKKIGC
jgi:hypothetical protein